MSASFEPRQVPAAESEPSGPVGGHRPAPSAPLRRILGDRDLRCTGNGALRQLSVARDARPTGYGCAYGRRTAHGAGSERERRAR